MLKLKQWTKNDLLLALLLILSSRIFYIFFGIIFNIYKGSDKNYFDLMNQWDAGWYFSISENGYAKEPTGHAKGDAANWAFFPLYPLGIHFFSRLVSLPIQQSGVILSTISLIVATSYLLKYVTITRNRTIAVIAAVLITYGPYSFYFSSTYTESLFAMLIILTLYNAQQKRWLLCGLFGAFLSATRPTGVLIFIPVLLEIVIPIFKEKRNIANVFLDLIKDSKILFSLLLIPSGLFAYMTFLYFHVGDAFAFSHVQIAWDRENGNPFKLLLDGLFLKGLYSKYASIWGIVAISLSVYLFIRKKFGEAILGFLCIIIPLLSSLQSIPRYVVGCIVLTIALSEIICRLTKWRWAIVVLFCIVNVPLTYLWFSASPYMA
ncbi:mannosyltransferase family protein [Paenibacillus sp. GYB003]|uniref:mannosyltransferase family protein n=1 Tax=Paenibacillus sp. GYB003 TaxID=2994392 RepID=UPI002F9676D3